MKYLVSIFAFLTLAISAASAGTPGSWQIEPPGEGSLDTYVYTTSNGSFLTGPNDSGLWLVYGGAQPPSADGSCSFDSCLINVIINGKNGYEQDRVEFSFSDGSNIRVDVNKKNVGNLISDTARVDWPTVRGITDGLKKSAWVDVSYPDGSSHRFNLKGSSATIKKAASIAIAGF